MTTKHNSPRSGRAALNAPITRRGFLGAAAVGATVASMAGLELRWGPSAAAATGAGPLRLAQLRTEYAPSLLGTDVPRPRLSWASTANGHGAGQSAYRLLVATSPERLTEAAADVWDSGKVVSDAAIGVEYAGPDLAPRTRYWWSVRAWDAEGRERHATEPAWFETGLREEGFRGAQWVGAPEPADELARDLDGASWIWSPGATSNNAPAGTRWFRGHLDVPAGEVATAYLAMTADDDYTAYLQGHEVLHSPVQVDGWKSGESADVTELVRAAAGGRLVLAAVANNRGAAAVNPGGVLAKLVVLMADGTTLRLVTDGSWRSSDTERGDWQQPETDDGAWDGVAVLAPYGQGPWGRQVVIAQASSLDLRGAQWIWSPGTTSADAPEGTQWFRGRLALPAGTEVASARFIMTADDDFTAYLDGTQVAHAPQQPNGWQIAQTADVTEQARAAVGRDLVLAVRATNRTGPAVNPAGLVGKLVVRTTASQELVLMTDAAWRTTGAEEPGWERPDHNDATWPTVAVLVPYGQGAWGSNVEVVAPERPAPLLRREFTLPADVSRARLYISGVAYHEARINGTRVGDAVLDPGFTDYDDTVLYVTHDVTELLRKGPNALGVELGRGFFGMTTKNSWRWSEPPWHGEPRLIARLVVEHPDGRVTEVVTDERWRVTDGPTRSNSLFAGETYDARRLPGGWDAPGFDDAGWGRVGAAAAPAGRLVAQENEPIRVLEDVAPSQLTSPRDGVWVADFGRTTAGWVRLRVTAPAGTTIRLVYGEKLNADGTVEAVNGHVMGGRFQLDEYITAGAGEEIWEPKFSYKGFRYVQVDGLPAAPTAETLTMRVVHSDVPPVAEFACSEPLFEQFDRMMRRTVLNNLHSIPTDTPLWEKNGWTGDVQLAVPTMAQTLGLARFFTKWLGDLRDSQAESGQIPVIVPSSGWGYRELAPSPEWTTVYPYLLREMYRWYGDERLLHEHWDPVVRYLDWELGRLQGGLAVTALGDYLSPGTWGNPPEDTRLTATAYLARALTSTAEVGELIGRTAEADRYREAAARLTSRLNDVFLDRGQGVYRTDRDPEYRQTSNAVPLAFGLVPDDMVGPVVKNLVADIERRAWHLNTGALGTSVLLPVLTTHGYPDVAAKVALQRTYPSWGFWVENGADTMWEMWHRESRSRNHFFQGTVVQWLLQHVAGLRGVDAGWREFVVRPDARSQLTAASLAVDTVRGRVASAWRMTDQVLHMDVDVPVGATAEVHVPAGAAEDVTVAPGPAASLARMEDGYAVYAVGSGTWRFVSRSAPAQ